MELTSTNLIYKSENFNSRWIWAKRWTLFFLILLVMLFWNTDYDSFLIKTAILAFIFLLLRGWPIDDIGIDENYVCFYRFSKFKRFSKETKYLISEISSFRCAGIYSKTNDILDFISPKALPIFGNEIEISFENKTSVSLNSLAYIKEIKKVRELLYEQKRRNLSQDS